MSNVLKSKALFGVMIAAAVVVAFSMFAITASAAYMHTGTLKMGMTSSNVMSLQQTLNANGFTVATAGAGSMGMESMYFGAKTKAAVMAFQASRGLTADGVVGPTTGGALAGLTGGMSGLPAGCTSTSGFSTVTGQACSGGSSNLPAGCTSTAGFSPINGARCDGSNTGNNNGSDGQLSGGETDISSVNLDDADDDTITEGGSDQEVAVLEFDVDDADAELVRMDLTFQVDDANNDENQPWRVFDKVSIMNGSDVIAEMDVDDEDVWDDDAAVLTGTNYDEAGAEAFSLRFNSINEIFDEGDNAELTITVDVASSVDGANPAAEWAVGIDDEGLRFTDSEGIDTFVDTNDVAAFSIEEAGGDSEITITQDTTSPDAGNLEVDEDSTTTATVAVFRVKADEDGADVKINDFPVTLITGGVGSENTVDVIDDVMVEIDGTTYTSDDDGDADNSADYTFEDIEDDDIVLEAGDVMKVTVKVKFKSQTSCGCANGVTILATSLANDNDFEDADSGDDIGDVSGTPSGETQTLYSTGITVSNFDSSFDTTSDGGLVAKQTYMIEFDVTAFGDTFYIPKVIERGIDGTDIGDNDPTGLEYLTETSAGAISIPADNDVGASQSGLTSSDADTVGAFFEVPEGETVTLKATIELNDTGDTAGFYHVQLSELQYDLDTTQAGTNDSVYTFAPAQDYETDDAKVD